MNMKTRFSALFLFISLFSNGQTITNYYNLAWKKTKPGIASYYCELVKTDSVWKSTCYYVSNKKLFNESYYLDTNYKKPFGKYVEYDSSGQVIASGNYANEKQHGLWLRWRPNGMIKDSAIYSYGIATWFRGFTENGNVNVMIDTDASGKTISKTFWSNGKLQQEGETVKGLKEGLWKVHVPDEGLVQEVRFVKDSVVSVNCIYNSDKKRKECIYERDAEFKGGVSAWKEYLTKKLTKYASKHYDEMRNGSVLVQFIIDKDGSVIDPKVIQTTDPALNAIALEFILDSPKWKPAVQYNRNVKAYRQQPITFVKPQ
jgi:antitoxin component YwqK of YwqJK toxin-antitoxin module